ncbi:MAG: hypothetical protein E6K35_13680 [Gammaproteobacteria bacterium]|nr:MAG: hypothetical protein E6K47_01310 [Gammaproteobacteria bacterium]TLY84956.1 MAG: hypothetical protein E6K35_13680 [Gammaproteobacteria bacterium]
MSGSTQPGSGATVSIQALSSIVQRLPHCLRGQTGLSIRYLRRKPGRGLVIVYAAGALTAGSAPHGRDPHRWLTVVVDEAALVGTRLRFSTEQLQQARVETRAPGILTIPTLALVVQVFPADNALPTLATSLRTAHEEPLFAELEAAARTQLGDPDWHICGARADPVRYKPGSRCLIRYTLKLEKVSGERVARQELSIFGKVYGDPEKLRAIQAAAQQLYAQQMQEGSQPIIPRPLRTVETLGLTLNQAVEANEGANSKAARPGLQVLRPHFTGAVDGETLDVDIPGKELRATAIALARLHTSAVRLEGPLRTGAKAAKRARERAALIATYCPVLADRAQRLAQQLTKSLAPLQPDTYRPAHGGFKPSQLLFCGERVFVVDLDGPCLADPALDVGYLLAYLRPNGLWYGRAGMRRWFVSAAAKFVSAYRLAMCERGIDETTIGGILERARLYGAATLFKIAARRIHRLNGPRPAELAAMLTEIEACMSSSDAMVPTGKHNRRGIALQLCPDAGIEAATFEGSRHVRDGIVARPRSRSN